MPFDMKVGEMIQGELYVAFGNLKIGISDSSGNSIHDFGQCSSRCSFHYAADYDGRHYLVVSNPDSFSGAREYDIKSDIVPTEYPPGTGSGKKTGEEQGGQQWWVIVVAVVVAIIGGITRKKGIRYRVVISKGWRISIEKRYDVYYYKD
jgi:hypothetical protein